MNVILVTIILQCQVRKHSKHERLNDCPQSLQCLAPSLQRSQSLRREPRLYPERYIDLLACTVADSFYFLQIPDTFRPNAVELSTRHFLLVGFPTGADCEFYEFFFAAFSCFLVALTSLLAFFNSFVNSASISPRDLPRRFTCNRMQRPWHVSVQGWESVRSVSWGCNTAARSRAGSVGLKYFVIDLCQHFCVLCLHLLVTF